MSKRLLWIIWIIAMLAIGYNLTSFFYRTNILGIHPILLEGLVFAVAGLMCGNLHKYRIIWLVSAAALLAVLIDPIAWNYYYYGIRPAWGLKIISVNLFSLALNGSMFITFIISYLIGAKIQFKSG